MGALKIPDELLEQASRIPGLSTRVAQFIKLEVAQYEQRQERFRPATLALVARAQEHAAERQATGIDRDEVMESFKHRIESLATKAQE